MPDPPKLLPEQANSTKGSADVNSQFTCCFRIISFRPSLKATCPAFCGTTETCEHALREQTINVWRRRFGKNGGRRTGRPGGVDHLCPQRRRRVSAQRSRVQRRGASPVRCTARLD